MAENAWQEWGPSRMSGRSPPSQQLCQTCAPRTCAPNWHVSCTCSLCPAPPTPGPGRRRVSPQPYSDSPPQSSAPSTLPPGAPLPSPHWQFPSFYVVPSFKMSPLSIFLFSPKFTISFLCQLLKNSVHGIPSWAHDLVRGTLGGQHGVQVLSPSPFSQVAPFGQEMYRRDTTRQSLGAVRPPRPGSRPPLPVAFRLCFPLCIENIQKDASWVPLALSHGMAREGAALQIKKAAQKGVSPGHPDRDQTRPPRSQPKPDWIWPEQFVKMRGSGVRGSERRLLLGQRRWRMGGHPGGTKTRAGLTVCTKERG
nr:uncharacterized protein LOC105875198 [Microcebus murinus]